MVGILLEGVVVADDKELGEPLSKKATSMADTSCRSASTG
jgi:hypothetical protein